MINNGVRHFGLPEPLRDRFRALLEHPDPPPVVSSPAKHRLLSQTAGTCDGGQGRMLRTRKG